MKLCNYKTYSYLNVKCVCILILNMFDILLTVINYKVFRKTKCCLQEICYLEKLLNLRYQ